MTSDRSEPFQPVPEDDVLDGGAVQRPLDEEHLDMDDMEDTEDTLTPHVAATAGNVTVKG